MKYRHAVSNVIFASVVIVLIVVASSGFLLLATRPATNETMIETVTHTASSTGTMNKTSPYAVAFAPAHGQMISSGWLIVAPLGNGSFAVSVYAKGLEPPEMGDYIAEAAQNTGQMAVVPIGGTNVTVSEFTTDSHGTGQFFIILHQNPSSLYENVSIVFLPGMHMQNATVVATAPLTMPASSHT
jgi:hypothetical protein